MKWTMIDVDDRTLDEMQRLIRSIGIEKFAELHGLLDFVHACEFIAADEISGWLTRQRRDGCDDVRLAALATMHVASHQNPFDADTNIKAFDPPIDLLLVRVAQVRDKHHAAAQDAVALEKRATLLGDIVVSHEIVRSILNKHGTPSGVPRYVAGEECPVPDQRSASIEPPYDSSQRYYEPGVGLIDYPLPMIEVAPTVASHDGTPCHAREQLERADRSTTQDHVGNAAQRVGAPAVDRSQRSNDRISAQADLDASREVVRSIVSGKERPMTHIVDHDIETFPHGNVIHLQHHVPDGFVPCQIVFAVPTVAGDAHQRYRFVNVEAMPPELQRVMRCFLDLTRKSGDPLTYSPFKLFQEACDSLAVASRQHSDPNDNVKRDPPGANR